MPGLDRQRKAQARAIRQSRDVQAFFAFLNGAPAAEHRELHAVLTAIAADLKYASDNNVPPACDGTPYLRLNELRARAFHVADQTALTFSGVLRLYLCDHIYAPGSHSWDGWRVVGRCGHLAQGIMASR